MANQVSVLQVSIDDAQYRAFVERVKQFRAEEAEAPKAWGGVAGHVDEIQKRFAEMVDSLAAQDGASEKIAANAGEAAESASTIGAAWGLMQVSARRFGGHVGGVTRDIAKWERAVTLFVGLTGAGSLYGLDKLAAAAAARRRSAGALGITTGQQAAFQTSFERLGDPDGLLAGFNRAVVDRVGPEQVALAALGVNPAGKNAYKLAVETLPKIKRLAEGTEDRMLGPQARAYGLGSLGVDENMMRLLKRMSQAEFAELIRSARANESPLDIPDDVGRAWQDLETQLKLAETWLQTAFADKLVLIEPGIAKLSDGLVGLIDKLLDKKDLGTWLARANTGIEAFAKTIGADSGQAKLRQALEHLRMSREDFDKLESWFTGHGGLIKDLAIVYAGYKAFSLGSKIGTFARLAALAAPELNPAVAAGALSLYMAKHGFGTFNPDNFTDTPENRHKTQNLTEVPDNGGGDDDPQAGDPHAIHPSTSTAPLPNAGGIGLRGQKDAASSAPGSADAYDKDISADISNQSTYGRLGEKITPEAFVVHHTGSRGTPESIMSTFNQRGFPAQYIMDRDGKITRALPEGNRGAHILTSATLGADGRPLGNDNTFGMEVIAKDDSDVTPAQVAAARKFYKDLQRKYPTIKEAYGHGYLNPGHKQATEGKTIADAIHADEHAAPLPVVTPAMAGAAAAKDVPLARRGFMGGYAGGYAGGDAKPTGRAGLAALGAHPNAKPPPAPAVHVTLNTTESQVTVHH